MSAGQSSGAQRDRDVTAAIQRNRRASVLRVATPKRLGGARAERISVTDGTVRSVRHAGSVRSERPEMGALRGALLW